MTVKEADRRIDRVAVALHNIAQAWADLAEFIPAGNDAKLVMERVFQDGRRFVNLNVKEEWAEIEAKLATIERENLLPKLTAIGAGPVLDLLKETHVTYGRVLGTTQAIEEAPEIRECRDALLDSLRSYTIQVAATVKRNDAASATRADVLLKPLREWESSKPAAPSAPAVPGDNQP